ncbi:MAG: N-acetyltransferase family protein [Clostridia bacterium]|nr:N-acetyltransferase family protein [Clostridia bacterium]
MIRPVKPEDFGACLSIYNYYIDNTTYTFETELLTEAVFSERILQISARFPFLVYEDDDTGAILGYCYLDRFAQRAAYRFSCDLSIYLAHDVLGRGIGHRLYEAIEKEAIRRHFYNIYAIITSQNTGSLAFHLRQGFREEGRFDGIAYKMGMWLGVRYLHKILIPERDGEPDEPYFGA